MVTIKEKRSKVVPIFRVVKNRKGELCVRIAGSSDDLLMSDGWWVKRAKTMESWIDALDHDGYSAEHMEWYGKERKLLVEAKRVIKESLGFWADAVGAHVDNKNICLFCLTEEEKAKANQRTATNHWIPENHLEEDEPGTEFDLDSKKPTCIYCDKCGELLC